MYLPLPRFLHVGSHFLYTETNMATIEDQILEVQKKIDACLDSEERKLLMKMEVQLREEKLIKLRREGGNMFLL